LRRCLHWRTGTRRAGDKIKRSADQILRRILPHASSVRCGLKLDWGVWIILALPPVLCAGPWIALGVLVVIGAWSVAGSHVLSREEKHEVWIVLRRYGDRLRGAVAAKPQAEARGHV
jgi:hypothetical protein